MTIRTQENADTIVEDLTNGIPLRQICRRLGISKSAVYDWFDDDQVLDGRIALARARGYHEIADESLEIVDNLEEEPSSRKIRAEHRLKLLAKWDPRRYGDKMDITSDGQRIGEFAGWLDGRGAPQPE